MRAEQRIFRQASGLSSCDAYASALAQSSVQSSLLRHLTHSALALAIRWRGGVSCFAAVCLSFFPLAGMMVIVPPLVRYWLIVSCIFFRLSTIYCTLRLSHRR